MRSSKIRSYRRPSVAPRASWRWRRSVHLALAAGPFLSLPLLGADAPPPLRLADVVAEARAANPAIEAGAARARAARSAIGRLSAYDDPVASWEAWNAPESFRIDHADNNIFRLSQKIPFPGKRSLAGRIAERDAAAAGSEAAATELDVVAMVEHAYYGLWQTHRNLAIYTRDGALVERLAKVTERKYALGQAPQIEVLRSQAELARLVDRQTTAGIAIDAARAGLNGLLGRPPIDPLGDPEDPPPPQLPENDEELAARALHDRPEVVARTSAVERERMKIHVARLGYLPDFEVSLARFVNSPGRDGFGATAALSLPFLSKSKHDSEVDEARAELSAAEADLREARDRVRREVRQAFLRARAALLRRELLATTHVPLAEQALAASETGYETGKVEFRSLIESLREVESLHLEHVAAEVELGDAFADLERAVGGPIERGEAR